MREDDSWAEYARIQALANSSRLSDKTLAAEETLEAILDGIEDGRPISAQQVDNLLTNRAQKQRKRRMLLAGHAHLLFLTAIHENDRLEARSELARHQALCSDREWRVLRSVGIGNTYGDISRVEDVPEATIKTWVRRTRLRLAA